MNMTTIRAGATNLVRAAGKTLEHHAPTILVAFGIGGVCTAGYLACKSTLKLPEALTNAKAEIEVIKSDAFVPETEMTPEEQEAERQKMLRKAYTRAAVSVGKLYIAPVFLGASSIACILASQKMLSDRCASALNAVTVTERLFEKYRQRVREEFGEEKDTEFRYGIHEHVIEEPVLDKNGVPKTDKNGEVKTTKRTVRTVDAITGDFARMFDEVSTHEWDRDFEYNADRLVRMQNIHDQMLQSRGYIFINEIYRDNGYPLIADGYDWGLVIDDETPHAHVSYGIEELNPATGRKRLDDLCTEQNAILLTFPGVRYIRDKVFRAQRVF